jgi:hypothetical protein
MLESNVKVVSGKRFQLFGAEIDNFVDSNGFVFQCTKLRNAKHVHSARPIYKHPWFAPGFEPGLSSIIVGIAVAVLP